MAGTYTQLFIHIIFAVKDRQKLIGESWRNNLFRYMSGIVEGKNQKAIIVNGVADHVHIFVGLRPSMSVADLTRDIKNNSSKFVNENGWVKGRFSWQEGYGAFSYSKSQVAKVYQYILQQEEHHSRLSFEIEYLSFLKKFGIDFDEKYVFD